MKRLWLWLWLLGHVPCARADARLLVSRDARFRAARAGEDGPRQRRLPFEPTVLAAGPGGRLAAAALIDEKDRSTVVVARSSDGGETWQKLPSPHAMTVEPRCGSENSSKAIVGLTLSLDDSGIEVYGADDNCEFAPWRYRWNGHGWQELDSQLSDDDFGQRGSPTVLTRAR